MASLLLSRLHLGADDRRFTPPPILVRRSAPKRFWVDDALKTEWAGFLQRWNWDFFLTYTFREPRQPHHAESTLNEMARAIRRIVNPSHLFLGTELHLSRTLHVHGLLQTRSRRAASPDVAERLWRDGFDRWGRCRVRPVLSRQAVTNYCTKYVTKDLTHHYMW